MRTMVLGAIAAVATVLICTPASAFHDGGVANCQGCHTMHVSQDGRPGFHWTPGARFIHPPNAMLTAPIADHYNGYVSSDDPNGGDPATSYLGLVPFEMVSVDLETVDPANATEGPSGGDRVVCLTCHRAHASPFADAGRWDFTATFLEADSHPRTGDGGASARDVINRYYGRTFTANQRSLCNKCHAKDYDDAPYTP